VDSNELLPKLCYSCASFAAVPTRVTATATTRFEVLMQCKNCLKEWTDITPNPPAIRQPDPS